MTLFDRQRFEAFISALPAVEIVHQWGNASVGKIGGKIFAIFADWDGDDAPHIAFKCSDLSFDLLKGEPGICPAKYLARAKWVEARPGSVLSEAELEAYITEAHRLIGNKLTKRVQAELGLMA